MSREGSLARASQCKVPSENEFESSCNQAPLVPSRAPLISIADPSQCQSKNQVPEKLESSKASAGRKPDGDMEAQVVSTLVKTPRLHGRNKPANSEPNSAQSTAIRSGPRFSIAGAGSGYAFTRFPFQLGSGGGRGGALPRVPRGISTSVPELLSADVPSFELEDDPSFWKDHNVQVLIRIRPLNSTELTSQGYGRCLRQESAHTVVWQGHPETRFTFDHIACETISQEKLFRAAGLPMVDNCMSGYNSCMFAYGQTGSGKTYTMMGEIDKMDGKLDDDCGITPRIFEYLFRRIKEEEESGKHERLAYSCKCSFLEIYNEQITDLLEPSSINLQIREDSKKGVYVENLTEYNVRTVNDVLQLLQQGAANRKIAATHMNSESSRSHSVFTCIVESRWEKDSMAHLRFGRLNLVDLAGSERQKSSGAEGDRLKEAANINKSLSTLGLVIMSLVDLAHGKHRHVPYRDSRLTFLLQDSLGGNSKTTIIANVSPSVCSANETLSTLKFAQRAKLIQNNAKINEDASGGVIALQQQIQQLKDQLSFLMKHQQNSEDITDFIPKNEKTPFGHISESHDPFDGINMLDGHKIPKEVDMKMHYLGTTLHGTQQREKLAETEVRRLQADIAHLNCLAHQQEEEIHQCKMTLEFREEKIKRLESLLDGLISADKFYLDENNALREENQLLQEKINRNPEVHRLASENIRLLEQIKQFQDYYVEGEREALLAEISKLRNKMKLMESPKADKCYAHHQIPPLNGNQETDAVKELKRCKDMNSKLVREVDELRKQVTNEMHFNQDNCNSVDDRSQRSDSLDEVQPNSLSGNNFTYGKEDEKMEHLKFMNHGNIHKQLMEPHCFIKTMKLEQFQLVKELESAQSENQHLTRKLENMEVEKRKLENQNENYETSGTLAWQTKLEKLSEDLKEAQTFNRRLMDDHETRLSQDHQTEMVRGEVEMETSRTIIQLQEEIDRLQSEFQVCLCSMAEQNLSLRNTVVAKETELYESHIEWERATLELTTFLVNGSKSLRDASREIKNISSSFPNVSYWISEQVERAAKICVEKEETILLLQKSLEDAQNTMLEMEQKLVCLKDAAIALTESQQPVDTSIIEKIQLSSMSDVSTRNKEFTKFQPTTTNGQVTDDQDNKYIFSENRVSDNALGSPTNIVVGNPTLAYTDTSVEKKEQHDETQFSLGEACKILSSLEEFFLMMQTGMEELLQTAQTDAIQVVKKILSLCGSVRPSLEAIICKVMQSDICTFVLQCQMGEFSHIVSRLNSISSSDRLTLQGHCLVADDLVICQDDNSGVQPLHYESKGHQFLSLSSKEKYLNLSDGDGVDKNSELVRELVRKDVLLKGLLFDFSLLQEFASHRKDIKDELEKLIVAMSNVQHELKTKMVQLDDVLIQNTKLEGRLSESEKDLFNSNSELNQAKEAVNILSEQNAELKDLLRNLYLKNSEAEQLLVDQKEAIRSLEREILRASSSRERQMGSPVDNVEDALAEVVAERDQLVEKLTSLQDKLDFACALADENQAIAVEARQESESSKMYAEQKEEEVKILERSIEELESTINVLEKKVHEMEEEVANHGLIRDSLELELQSLRRRLFTIEDFTESMTSESSSTATEHLSRSMENNEAHSRIRFLEEENRKQAKEIRQFKDYISEIVLHAEAQASQYQQKYKALEAMLHEVKTDTSNVSSGATLDRSDKASARTRGSSSPFRCISGLVHQMNQEKDHELSSAKLRIEELEALAASRYKEVCMLNTRLAAAESMTHDVIRDLLSVKLDISNYANIVDHHQLQKLIEEAQHHKQDFASMEQEILFLRSRVEDLLEERERCITEIDRNKSDQLATRIALEQFEERDQLLIAQNDMLKIDKHNLQMRVAELDDMVKKLLSVQELKPRNQHQKNSSSRPFDYGLGLRLAHPQSRVNNQLAQHRRPDATCSNEGVNNGHGNRIRKPNHLQ
ncbi:Phragmoplast orienting kinesin-1 [Striga hermonthica]|uniref:Phragmoplast orienting kinesin-1 n=1 Tax=Striga hermonthica TaxID=68872 RepID=A0A9N7RIP2_STRHE|nr:Phragmoplast orienting kinesin-1 [Striga hermonthica]